MVLNSDSVRKQFETMSLKYNNNSHMDPSAKIFKILSIKVESDDFTQLANRINESGLKGLLGEKIMQKFEDRLRILATMRESIDDESLAKVYYNVGHFLCEWMRVGTFPRRIYDQLTDFVKGVCPNMVKLKETDKNDYMPKFSIAIATTGSDLDAVIEILLGDQTLQVSTILIQEALKESFKIKLSNKCASFLENGYTTGLEAETVAIANEAKQLGALVGEFQTSTNIMAFVYDLLPLKSFKRGNVLFIMPFRTAAEAAKLASNVDFIAASVWGDNITTALSIAHSLQCNNVWINCHGLAHPSVPLYPKPVSKVPKSDLIKFLDHEIFQSLVQRWKIVPNVAPPKGCNILTRPLGPVGTVSVPYRENFENLFIPALYCGNEIQMHFNSSKDVNLILGIPKTLFTTRLTKGNEINFVFVNGRKIPYEDLQTDGEILANFVNTQYIWLPETEPL